MSVKFKCLYNTKSWRKKFKLTRALKHVDHLSALILLFENLKDCKYPILNN